jgi:hypothetical protein
MALAGVMTWIWIIPTRAPYPKDSRPPQVEIPFKNKVPPGARSGPFEPELGWSSSEPNLTQGGNS